MDIPKRFFDICVHAGKHDGGASGDVVPPLYVASTYEQAAPGEPARFDYSRAGNPTRANLEDALAGLEEANYALSFSSGLAAEQAILQTFEKPVKVLVCDDVYGGSGRLFRTLFAKYGFEFEFFDLGKLDEVKRKLAQGVELLWVETPTNPLLKVFDIKALCSLAKTAGARVVVDNTFASPVLQSPLELGADIVLHSSSKYLGGHSDLIGGCVMLNDKELYEKIKYIQFAAGAVPSPFDCHLFLRSISTLAVRMKMHNENGQKVAQFLEQHPKVERVFYPGLESHPQFKIAQEQMRGPGAMLSFDLKGDYNAVKGFLSSLKMIRLAESLGAVESLINHPARMTHASVPEALRAELGITDSLLRLSVGIESSEGIIEDLSQALS